MSKHKSYHYTESGLDNIWLENGFEFVDTTEGRGVIIHNVRQLNRVIGFALVDALRPLKPREFKFLRVEMDLSQKKASEILGVDAQTVGRWERGETGIPASADRLMRVYFKTYHHEDSKVKEFIDRMAELDDEVDDDAAVNLVQSEAGWKTAA